MAQLYRIAFILSRAFWLHVSGARGLDRQDILLAGIAFALVAMLWTALSFKAWMPVVVMGGGALGYLADRQMLELLPRLEISHGQIGSGLWFILLARVIVLGLTSGLGLLGLGLWRLLTQRPAWRWGGWIALGGQLLASIWFLDMWLIEPLTLNVSRVEITSEKLDPSAAPIRIVQISDIHMVAYGPREQRVVARVNRLEPDLVVLTGDYVNELSAKSYQALASMMGDITAPHGVYAVTGNIDLSIDQISSRAFRPTGVRLLRNTIVDLDVHGQRVQIVGLSAHGSVMGGLDLMRSLQEQASESYRILLFHYPDFAELASQASVDLYLAGHTHGGQVRVPFYGALLVNSLLSRDYNMGLYDSGDSTLFVSRGIGFSGGYEPQIRFRCPPEVVMITLRGDAKE